MSQSCVHWSEFIQFFSKSRTRLGNWSLITLNLLFLQMNPTHNDIDELDSFFAILSWRPLCVKKRIGQVLTKMECVLEESFLERNGSFYSEENRIRGSRKNSDNIVFTAKTILGHLLEVWNYFNVNCFQEVFRLCLLHAFSNEYTDK